MKAYIIVRGMNLDDLTERVDELVVEGYIPVGGPANIGRYVIQAVYHPAVCQVLFRLDGNDPLDNKKEVEFPPTLKGLEPASGDCGSPVRPG